MKKYDLKNIDREELADLLEQEMREAGLETIDDGVEREFDDDDDCAFDLVPNSGSSPMDEREPPRAVRALAHSIRTSDEVSGDTIEIDVVDSRERRVLIALCWDGESARWNPLSTRPAPADKAVQSPEKEPSP